MRRNVLVVLVGLVLVGAISAWPGLASARMLDGRWTLTVRDTDHRERVVAVLRFDSKTAESCLGGDWKRVVVESASRSDERFFPVAGPLAWELEDGALTIGRTAVCDAYVLMRGPMSDGDVAGPVYHYGKGGRTVFGEFILRRAAD